MRAPEQVPLRPARENLPLEGYDMNVVEHEVATPRPSGRSRRPWALWPLLAAMAFLAMGGFFGGISFITDTTGAGIGAKLSWLENTPVNDFLLPGLFLLGVYGIGTAILMVALIWPFSPGPLRRLDAALHHRWAWAGTMLAGAVLIVWILYEFVILADRMILQPLLIGVGIVMMAIPLLPSMRAYCSTTDQKRSGGAR
jgi:hypothetical protein